MATRHLIELGHRGIYHLAGPQDWIEAEARMRGFLDEMSAQDVPTTAPILGDWTAEFGYYAGRELLTVRDFTAIFASNDQMALGLMHAVRDFGLEIPRDVVDHRVRRHPRGRALLAAAHDRAAGLRRARAPVRRAAARRHRGPLGRPGARRDRPRAHRPRFDRAGGVLTVLSIRDLDELTVRSGMWLT